MTDHPVKRRKKLIEVAIPLEAINAASELEKQPFTRKHPRSLHIWWARRPHAAARAVIFSQLVDDPSSVPEEFPTEEAQENERLRLFALISELVQWENTTNEDVLNRAREEIRRNWRRCCTDNADHPDAADLFNPEKLPGFHDPFAGGGALPLEAQRLGLESCASDLNPVAVLINKAMIEIPPKFAGMPPVNPDSRRKLDVQTWKGAQGLAEDVRYYGQWMGDQAKKRIGNLYPKVEVTVEMAKERPDLNPFVGRKLSVIAWIWARTVKSSNPAFSQLEVPLASTFILSNKAGKEAYVEPVIESNGYRFTVKVGKPKDLETARNGTSAGKRAAFRCLMSDTPLTYDYIRAEGQGGRIGVRLMAVVAEGIRGRVYLAPTPEMEATALNAEPNWKPETLLPENPRDFKTPNYGLATYGDLFTTRQLVALTTFSDLVQEVRENVKEAALKADRGDDVTPLCEGGTSAFAYAEAIGVYLGLATSRWADMSNSLCSWNNTNQNIRALFSHQAIPMNWDFAELSPFSSVAPWMSAVESACKAMENLAPMTPGYCVQLDAASSSQAGTSLIYSTDPPYYDNIGYADLSDFFYVWLRHSLRQVFPDLFATLAVPKAKELVCRPGNNS